MSSRVEVLEQQVRDLTSSVETLVNEVNSINARLAYVGSRARELQEGFDKKRQHLATEYEGREKLRDK